MVDARIFRNSYKREKEQGIPLAKMTAKALAGYYLLMYPGDPISAINYDMRSDVVSQKTGYEAKVLIEVVLKED